jgi:hypothetical protein
LNIVRGERKEGNDWFWAEGTARDRKYGPYPTLSDADRETIVTFFGGLPLVVTTPTLRVVHAAWHPASIQSLQGQEWSAVRPAFDHFEARVEGHLDAQGLAQTASQERALWAQAISDPTQPVPMLEGVATADEMRQMGNPVRVLTSGIERRGHQPFFSSGQWRFVERVRWWDEYEDDTPVVVGHYWRLMAPVDRSRLGKGDPDLFCAVPPTAWHGPRRNVFCVDYSAGGRYRERLDGRQPGAETHLAALRWPERILFTDTGLALPTTR